MLALTLLSRPLPPALFWDYIQITPKSVNAAVRGCATFNVLFQSDGRILERLNVWSGETNKEERSKNKNYFCLTVFGESLALFQVFASKKCQFNSKFLTAKVFDGK